ncbi:TolC family protein [Dyella silvae]|uniref:TolC family protein n=1 Tax=Dyella silvae TaxID=2994424 RepID=UPI002263E831|nr:TolC family protein [Dyella silvae]
MRANLALVVVLVLSGCATSALQMAPTAPDRPWSPTVDAAGALSAKPVSGAQPPSSGYVLPPNPVASGFPPAAIDSERVYGLADLIDLAESTNPETRIAWNDARNAALTAGMARSTYLPRISATVLGGRQSANGNGTALSGLSVGQSESASGTVSVLSIDWLLFDFGRREALVDAADQGTVIANVAFTAAHQKLIHVVSVAFYTYSATRARADSTQASLRDAQEILTAAESRKQHGIGTVVEVAQARQFAAQAELARIRADGDQSDAYVALLSALGVSPLSHIRIADISQRPLPTHLDQPIETVVEHALQRRPDVLAAIATQKAAEAGVRAAKADFLPKVFVSASGTYNSGNFRVSAIPAVGDQAPTVNLSNRQWGTTIMFGVSVPIYNGGVRNAALAQARNREDSAEDALERVKLGAAQEVVMAHSKLRTSLAAMAAAQALLDASQTTYDAALAAYRRGVGSSTDVLTAERQLLEARDATADAHSAALSAAATLALVCGSLGSAPD